jgi:hypothetical protein
MMRLARRPVLILGLLLAAAAPAGSARAAPPRGMGGMRGGMLPPVSMHSMMMPAGMSMFGAPQGMGSRSFLPMAPGMGLYGSSTYSMAGRSGYGSGGMGSAGGYSGGGSGTSSGGSTGSPGLSGGYPNPYDWSAPAPSQTASPAAGPLSGLLTAEGGLEWPLVLRLLPPEARDLRQQIDARVGEVQRQAAAGSVDAGLLRDMNRDVEKLREILADRADRLPVSEQATADGRQFIRKLRHALASAK